MTMGRLSEELAFSKDQYGPKVTSYTNQDLVLDKRVSVDFEDGSSAEYGVAMLVDYKQTSWQVEGLDLADELVVYDGMEIEPVFETIPHVDVEKIVTYINVQPNLEKTQKHINPNIWLIDENGDPVDLDVTWDLVEIEIIETADVSQYGKTSLLVKLVYPNGLAVEVEVPVLVLHYPPVKTPAETKVDTVKPTVTIVKPEVAESLPTEEKPVEEVETTMQEVAEIETPAETSEQLPATGEEFNIFTSAALSVLAGLGLLKPSKKKDEEDETDLSE